MQTVSVVGLLKKALAWKPSPRCRASACRLLMALLSRPTLCDSTSLHHKRGVGFSFCRSTTRLVFLEPSSHPTPPLPLPLLLLLLLPPLLAAAALDFQMVGNTGGTFLMLNCTSMSQLRVFFYFFKFQLHDAAACAAFAYDKRATPLSLPKTRQTIKRGAYICLF